MIGLATALAAYGLYAVLVAPWLNPPPPPPRENTKTAELPPKKAYDFAALFPPGSWQLDNPKVIEADSFVFLLKDYHPLPDGKMKLTPCTALVYTGSTPEDRARPLVLDAPGGAELQFNRDLDVTQGKFGELQGGKLPGDIRIFRPESKPGANDGVELTTRNVQLDMQRIWTPHEVNFRYGGSYGSGRDLTIMLVPRDSPAALSAKGVAGNLQSLQLAEVDVVHVETAGGLLGGKDAPQTLGPAKAPQPPVEIRCRGPFLYDFLEQTASFQDEVVIQRLNPHQEPDSLKCDRVALRMRDEPPSGTPNGAPATDSNPNKSAALQSRLSTFEATGETVQLDVPSNGTFATAARIEYDFVKRRLVLMPGPRTQEVQLRHGQTTFRARQLEYELPATGRLGRLWAEGPGEFGLVQGEPGKAQTLRAFWQKELRIRPQDDAKVLSLIGRGSVGADGMGGFSADEVHLWVKEHTSPANAAAAPGALGLANAGIQPTRMLAEPNVVIDTPQLAGKANRLEVWFDGFAPQVAAARPLPPATQPVHKVTAYKFDPVRAPDVPPGGNPAIVPLPAHDEPPAQFGRFDLQCELIRARILRVGAVNHVEDLTLEGGVRMVEANPPLGGPPTTVTGDIVQLQRGSTDDAVLQIVGRPAHFAGRGMKLSGKGISLNRGANKAWMEGGGEAELPIPESALTPPAIAGAPPTTQPARAAAPKSARVTWHGDARFDGQRLTLLRDVLVKTEQQQLTADSLTLTLIDYVDFARSKQERPPQVAKVDVSGNVYLQSRSFDKAGRPSSYDQFQLRSLSLDQSTGRIEGIGPGWLSTVRTGAALPAGPAGAAQAAEAATGRLNYVLVEFQGDMAGNMGQLEVQFERRVRTVFGPVANWDQQFKPNSKAELGESGVLLTSDKLRLVQMKLPNTDQQWFEFEAAGNTLVEGKIFTARGQRIGYASGKEQLVLEGDGRSAAELWYTGEAGQPTGYQRAQRIRFNRLTNALDIDGAEALQLNQLNGIAMPKLPGIK